MTARARRAIVGFCCYCRRDLLPPHLSRGNSLTFDHVKPQAAGGFRRVPCCRDCNQLKGSLEPPDWFWFIHNHRRWWKSFKTPEQVSTVIRTERTRRAFAGEPQIDWNTTRCPAE